MIGKNKCILQKDLYSIFIIFKKFNLAHADLYLQAAFLLVFYCIAWHAIQTA